MPRLPSFAPDCPILLDGESVPARRGEPVAAALLAAGKPLVSRSAKYHRPRGAFCLAGTCGTCLVRGGRAPEPALVPDAVPRGALGRDAERDPRCAHDVLGLIDRSTRAAWTTTT